MLERYEVQSPALKLLLGATLARLVRKPAELLLTDKAFILAGRAMKFDEVRIVEATPRQLTLRSSNASVSVAKAALPDGAFDEVVAFVRARTRRS